MPVIKTSKAGKAKVKAPVYPKLRLGTNNRKSLKKGSPTLSKRKSNLNDANDSDNSHNSTISTPVSVSISSAAVHERKLNSISHMKRAIKFHKFKARYASEILMRLLFKNQDFLRCVGLIRTRRRPGPSESEGSGNERSD